jgi:hypothetical protein
MLQAFRAGATLLDRFVSGRSATAEFDHYAIFEGDKPMIVIPEESAVSLPRGFSWDWQLSIDVLSERLTHYEHI